MYVRLGFDRTSPSLMIPTPILLALPSNPITTVMVSGRMKLEDTQNTATQCLAFYSQNRFIYVLMSILQKCKCVFKRFLQFSQFEFTIKVKYVMSGCTYATHAAG